MVLAQQRDEGVASPRLGPDAANEVVNLRFSDRACPVRLHRDFAPRYCCAARSSSADGAIGVDITASARSGPSATFGATVSAVRLTARRSSSSSGSRTILRA